MYTVVREPIDRMAGQVVQPSRNGRFYVTSQVGQHQLKFKERIAGILASPHTSRVPRHATDFTGEKFGRLTVISYSHTKKKRCEGNVHYWVVRCACGEYEMRKHTSLNAHAKGAAGEGMCAHCWHLVQIQRQAARRYNR